MNKGTFNLAPLGILASGANLQPGMVGMANSELMADTFFSEPMTEYAVGWRTEDNRLEELLEALAPAVRTSDRFEYRVADDAAAFAAIENKADERALNGEFKTIMAHGQIENGATLSKGLTTVIDKRIVQSNPRAIEEKVGWLKRMLLRAEILRAAALLNANATNKAVTWGGDSGSQPDMDLADMVLAGGDAAGFDPNTIVMPAKVWQIRLATYGAVNTAAGFAGFAMTPDGLRDWLAIDRVYVSRERYGNGVATAKHPILGTNVAFAFNAQRGATPEDPSNIKRFWSPEQGGGEWAVWVQDKSSHLVYVTVSHYSAIAITSSLGIRKLTVTQG